MAADVGGLIADIGLNVAGLREDIKQSNRELGRGTNKMNRHLGSMRKRVDGVTRSFKGLVGTIALGFGISKIADTANALEEVDRQARSLGASLESIQELTLTFREFNLDANDVSDTLGTLSDRAQDAKDGMQSFIDDFRLLGVEVDDLRGKRPEELLELVARRVAGIEDPTRRTAGIVRIFGDDLGRKLAPLLLQGAEGLEKYADRWHELGVIVNDEGVASGVAAAEAFRELKTVLSGSFTRLVAENAEEIATLAEAMTSLATGTASFFAQVGKGLALVASGETGFGAESDVIGKKIDSLRAERERVDALLEQSEGRKDGGFFARFDELIGIPSADELRTRLAEIKAELDKLKQQQIDVLTRPPPVDEAPAREAGQTQGAAFSAGFNQELERSLQIPGFSADRLTPEMTADQMFPVGKIVAPAFRELQDKATDTADTIDEEYNGLAQSIGGSLQRSFSDAFLGIETGFGDMLRRMAADLAASGLLHLIASMIPGPIGAFLTAGLPGFKDGGSFTVGGSGGSDSQLVAFRATPGEQVTVTPTGHARGGIVIQQEFHVQAGLPPQWTAQLATVTSIAAATAKEAIGRELAGRR